MRRETYLQRKPHEVSPAGTVHYDISYGSYTEIVISSGDKSRLRERLEIDCNERVSDTIITILLVHKLRKSNTVH